MVIVNHSYVALSNTGILDESSIVNVFAHADYGVDIFFALSGYLICTLLLREKARTGDINLRSFYIRRVFRILPPVIVYLAVLAFLPLPVSGRESLATLFFWRNYSAGSWYTVHFWTLAVEEHFYLVIPVLLMVFSRKHALRISLFLIAACFCTRIWESGFIPLAQLQMRTENRLDAPLWGCAWAIAGERIRLAGWMVILACLTGGVLVTGVVPTLYRRPIVALVLPMILYYTVSNSQNLFGKILEWRPLRWLGRISFSVYIWQMLFLVDGRHYLGAWQALPIALLPVFGCAVLSYYLIEKPFIAIGYRLAAQYQRSDNFDCVSAAT
jgi:peptidoglycan/LPS O-acetylase OafA/YrhL